MTPISFDNAVILRELHASGDFSFIAWHDEGYQPVRITAMYDNSRYVEFCASQYVADLYE